MSVSLRGPVLNLTARAKPEFDGLGGWDGWDGLDGDQKCPLIYFILRYIKHYTHIYLNKYTYDKVVRRNLLWVQVGFFEIVQSRP